MPDFFSQLSSIGDTLQANRKQQTLADLGTGLADGTLDYKQAAGAAAKTGNLDLTLKLLQMDQQRSAYKSYQDIINSGDQSQPAPTQPRPQTLSSLGQPRDEELNGSYGPIIANAAGKYGLDPPTFNRQLKQESNFNPNAVSPAGAQGIAQFMPATARERGVNPNDPNSAIPGAASYMADLKRQFSGNDGLALMAYNWGSGNVQKWLQSGADPSRIPNETRSYVQNITGKPVETWLSGGVQQGNSALSFAPQGADQPQTHQLPPVAGPQQAPPQQMAQAQAPMNLAAPGTPAPQAQPMQQPQPAQGTSGPIQNPAMGNFNRLVGMLGLPGMDKGQQEGIKLLAQKALDDAAKTPEEKQYRTYASQALNAGQQPMPFFDYQIKLKQAGATAITNDMRGENAESAAYGKGAGEAAVSTLKAATSASKELVNLNRVGALLDRVKQGKIEPARMNLSAWAKSLGLNDSAVTSLGLNPQDVGDAQALNALTSNMVIGKIGSGGFPANNFSDADREFLMATLPRLGNDADGNTIIIEAGRRMAQLDIQKAREWMAFKRDPANKGKGYYDFETGWADKIASKDQFGDLYNQAAKLMPQGAQPNRPVPQFSNPTDVNAAIQSGQLKSGDVFRTLDGRMKKVP